MYKVREGIVNSNHKSVNNKNNFFNFVVLKLPVLSNLFYFLICFHIFSLFMWSERQKCKYLINLSLRRMLRTS